MFVKKDNLNTQKEGSTANVIKNSSNVPFNKGNLKGSKKN